MSSGLGSPNSSLPCAAAMHGNGFEHNNYRQLQTSSAIKTGSCDFQMPLHYPKYKKSDYEKMPEWRLEALLNEYGLPATGDLQQKRKFAMGAFLWPDQQ